MTRDSCDLCGVASASEWETRFALALEAAIYNGIQFWSALEDLGVLTESDYSNVSDFCRHSSEHIKSILDQLHETGVTAELWQRDRSAPDGRTEHLKALLALYLRMHHLGLVVSLGAQAAHESQSPDGVPPSSDVHEAMVEAHQRIWQRALRRLHRDPGHSAA